MVATIVDLTSNVAFQQARHQNNLYYAQGMLRSKGDAASTSSETLKTFQGELKKITFSKATLTPEIRAERIRQVQDVMAAHHLYLMPDRIEHYFFDSKTHEIKTDLVNGTEDALDLAWGKLAFEMMKESLAGYIAVKGTRPGQPLKEGETRKRYIELDKDLQKLGKTPTSRVELWAEVAKAADFDKFAEDVKFNETKIEAHRDFLNVGFYGLAENEWWTVKKDDKDDKKGYKYASTFRDTVVLKNGPYKPKCYMRATSDAPRGKSTYQSTYSGGATRRVQLKNSPFSMEELATLINDAQSPTLSGYAVGPTPPVSLLKGKSNPMHEIVFSILGTWYIVGAEVNARGSMILQKHEIIRDAKTGEFKKKINSANNPVSSLLSTDDMQLANGVDGKPISIITKVEEGVKAFIDGCDYGVTVNDAPDEEIIADINALTEPSVLFACRKEDREPYSDVDKAALKAIVWTDLLQIVLAKRAKAKDSTYPPSHNKLVEDLKATINEYKGVIAADELGLREPAELEELDEDDKADLLNNILDKIVVQMETEQARGKDSKEFEKECIAIEKVIKHCKVHPKDILANPLEPTLLEEANLSDFGLVSAISQCVGSAERWVSPNPKAKTRILVAVGGKDDDVISVGLKHLCTNESDPTKAILKVTLKDGTNVNMVRYDAPADAKPGRLYFKPTNEKGADFHPDDAQLADLQEKLQPVLKAAAEKAVDAASKTKPKSMKK